MTGDFAIVAEGYTDQLVLKQILLGLFEQSEDEPFVNFEQPLLDQTSRHRTPEPGGWDQVLKYLQLGKYRQALQLNRYLVIHIDTDVSEEFGVPKQLDGKELEPHDLVAATVDKLRSLIDESVLREHGDRLLFAIAVHSTECWLLPLVFDRSQPQKRAKTVGCLAALDDELRKSNRTPLSTADSKNPDAYRAIVRDYRKRKVIDEGSKANPSLGAFVAEVARRNIRIPAPDL